jgi:hypothetical protein
MLVGLGRLGNARLFLVRLLGQDNFGYGRFCQVRSSEAWMSQVMRY